MAAEEFRVPDSTEPLLGWRVWHLDRDGLLQPIVVTGRPWLPGPNEARCHMPDTKHRAPGPRCVCGFNALHNPPNDFRGVAGHALGVIAAWGDVDVYGTGLRAQFAAVVGLLDEPVNEFHGKKLAKAAAHYGVPLLRFPGLRQHARQFGRPASGAVLPSGAELPRGWGMRSGPGSRVGVRRRSNRPLPAGTLPSAFAGRGVWINRHLAVDHDGRFMRLGPTPSLGALASGGIEPAVEAGQEVNEGDALFVATAGPSVIPAPSPVRGTVIHMNGDPLRPEEGPAAGGWVVELRLESDSLDHSSIAWGRRGAEAYRAYVLAAGSDADLLLRCAHNPNPANALVAADEARGWLRALAQQLDAAIRADPSLCGALRSLDGRAAATTFLVDGVEAMRVAAPAVGSERWVTTGPPERIWVDGEVDGLAIELRPQALRAWWRGELGLAPDDVSEAAGIEAALADDFADRRNPLHVLAGTRGDVLIANSMHRRVFDPGRVALDGLGDPWFRAGDALRDPVESLRVLAGFEPPAAMGGAA